MSDVLINVRVDAKLKEAFSKCAKSQDLTASQMLRNYMRYEVEKQAKASVPNQPPQSVKGRKNARKNR